MLLLVSYINFYPNIAEIPIKTSYFYLLYFIPYLLLFITIFIPIPLALAYDNYLEFRKRILIKDKMK